MRRDGRREALEGRGGAWTHRSRFLDLMAGGQSSSGQLVRSSLLLSSKLLVLEELLDEEQEEDADELDEELDRQDSRRIRLLGSRRVLSEDTPSTMSEMSVLVGVVTALSGKVDECSDNR